MEPSSPENPAAFSLPSSQKELYGAPHPHFELKAEKLIERCFQQVRALADKVIEGLSFIVSISKPDYLKILDIRLCALRMRLEGGATEFRKIF